MILIPIGTKAQLIKMAPVILEIRKQGLKFDFVLTGQHQETMSDLIEGFGLPEPAYTLAPIEEANTSKKLLGWLIKTLKNNLKSNCEIAKRKYKICLVHGDTMSTLIGALLAKRHGIAVAHVEAGLRSHSLLHPFPEELTRRIVSKIASIYYCSGTMAINNIKKTKKNADIVDTGQNTLLDSVRFSLAHAQDHQKVSTQNYCVASIHRFENISNRARFRFILDTIFQFSQEINVKFVLHSATRHKLSSYGWMEELEANPKIELLPRMNYFKFTDLISKANFIMTDGGSNQEECSYLNIPNLLMRQHTERDEGLGSNSVLSKYDSDIINAFFNEKKNHNPTITTHLPLHQEKPSLTIALDLKKRIEKS
ncbi:UDP-N-acetylglucosamine 2-epimerase [Gilvimarinus polysaccharolyticus]|uniref:UDP-N-acetylglucosamine 2-epimerase n=1 Tax=Gilvimarinus polysaccharolyticus TaxID=863921 RepID=UPI00067349D2|nr:UDP-N-acetylglucosamine 2-epimerase [Gilvimarinus polysaccharolyticus]